MQTSCGCCCRITKTTIAMLMYLPRHRSCCTAATGVFTGTRYTVQQWRVGCIYLVCYSSNLKITLYLQQHFWAQPSAKFYLHLAKTAPQQHACSCCSAAVGHFANSPTIPWRNIPCLCRARRASQTYLDLGHFGGHARRIFPPLSHSQPVFADEDSF